MRINPDVESTANSLRQKYGEMLTPKQVAEVYGCSTVSYVTTRVTGWVGTGVNGKGKRIAAVVLARQLCGDSDV